MGSIKRKFLLLEECYLDIAKKFGVVLREMRINAGMTQEQLGLEADLRRTFISLLELGQQQPTLTTLVKISHALKCPAHEIVAKFEAYSQK
jgi:DNA-binding XRE family transcriptional regulator